MKLKEKLKFSRFYIEYAKKFCRDNKIISPDINSFYLRKTT